LQTGVVDGQENTWSNIYGQKFFEVQDGVTETNHGIIDYLVVTSVDFMDSLPEDAREQFTTIVNEVTESRNAESTAVDLENKDLLVKAETEIRVLDTEQRQAWVDAMKPVWEQFAGDIGQDLIDKATSYNSSN
jgi:C4-dicarboxylate-binding protein DctP